MAISGGGIRSATFGLGVLEGLKELGATGLLKYIDYLSTVSGGGYIGAWLSANCKRAADRKAVNPDLPEWLDKNADWKNSIAYLRRYSNYLSPQIGFFSADTWSIAAIWIRNTLLVQVTVILAIAVALLLPRPLHSGFEQWPLVGYWRWTSVALFIIGVVGIAGNQKRLNTERTVFFLQGKNWKSSLAAGGTFLLAAWATGYLRDFDPFTNGPVDYKAAFIIGLLLVLAGFFLQPVGVKLVSARWRGKNAPRQVNYTQGWVQALVVLPMMVTGYLVAAVLWNQSRDSLNRLSGLSSFGGFFKEAWEYWPLPLSVAFASLWLLSFCSIRSSKDWKGLLVAFVAPIPSVLVLHALFCAIMLLLHGWAKDPAAGSWQAFVWAPALVLYAFALAIVMLIGMMGRQSSESVREWWSRFGAWLGIYGVAWMVIAVAGVYGPRWAALILDRHSWTGYSMAAGWLGTTVAGLLAGKSDSTGAPDKDGQAKKTTAAQLMEVVAKAAPFVFIAGLLVGVSTCLHLIILMNSVDVVPQIAELHSRHWQNLTDSSPEVVLAVLGGTIVGLLLMAARVDINEFSLNAFYRSRLIRCYLGATRYPGERSPQNFTGFDEKDDLCLAELGGTGERPPGPLHLINCALNLGGSSDLALHTRHSASFTLSPYATGSAYLTSEPSGARTPMGYRRTAVYGGKDGQPTLGQAISVSGAAASPNMGYHTSPVVAFLLTVFNVRLGWWFPNPRMSGTESPSPWFSLRYLFKELFGGADDKSKFLMVSDGGHFENLAAYELIKRKCRVVIISDGECDPQLHFEGLGTLIRVCDVDFGTRIILDVSALRRDATSNWSSNRCAVGRIVYGGGVPDGVLIYLKASMTGREDTAVLQYRASHPLFPHESTGDQFYGEDQFESYRQLGREIARKTFEPVVSESGERDFVTMATELRDICSPTMDHIGRFTQQTSRLMDLWNHLGSNPQLQVFDEEFEKSLAIQWPDESSPESFRPAFFVCSQMIQIMENVYLDLGLEDTWEHPDNEGWRKMFLLWSRSPAIRKTWSMSHMIFGLRFQYFCARRLNLPIPDRPGSHS